MPHPHLPRVYRRLMQEDLLGYLLGALEPDEMRRVAHLLRHDPTAQAELERIEQALRPLEDGDQVELPPSDLVSRTLAALPPMPTPETETPVTLAAMADSVDPPRSSSLSWMDWASGSVAVAILLGLLLPALAQGRFESRKVACQDQLRRFGVALTQFVIRNQQHRLPQVSEEGPEAFAGMYAVRLYDAGLLEDASSRWCPSRELPMEVDTPDPSVTLVSINDVVSSDQLRDAPVDQLKQWQRSLGGHYAYTLGVVDRDTYLSPRFEGRSSFAIMSDAPMVTLTNRVVPESKIGHDGFGINVLFEDGRVRFFTLQSLEMMPDHPLLNDRGHAEAGVNIDDASLGPSWEPPFVNVLQR